MSDQPAHGCLTQADLLMLGRVRRKTDAEAGPEWTLRYGKWSWRAAFVCIGILSPGATDAGFAELDAQIAAAERAEKSA